MSSEILLNAIRNVVAIDRATSACTNGLQVGETVYFSDPAASRILKLTGFSRPESDGRWTDGSLATIDLKLAPESVEIGRLRIHVMPFVTEDKGQTLRLRCGEGPEQVVEFFSGTLAWRMVDLPLTGVRADSSVLIQIAVAHTSVPSKLGISPDPRALGVMVGRIELVSNAVAEDLVQLAIGSSITLSSADAELMIRLAGFGRPEPDGRWIDGSLATIDLKLAPESVEIGRLRLHMMPFVTEDKGQTLRLRCGEGPEQVVEFSPGTLAWRMVDLPLTGVRADTSVRIQIAVAHTFVPSKLGISPDPRALGVMVRRIELVSNAVAEDFVPLAIGSSITLSSADAELMIRLAGFGRPEPDGRWIDGSLATIDLKLAPESVEIGRLRLHMMPFVTEDKGQTLRLRCGEGPEQVVEFSPGPVAWRRVDLPLTGVRADTSVRIQIAVAHTFVPSKLGISPDPRALGVMVRRIELVSNAVAEDFVPLAIGSSITLSSADAELMIRLAGFGRPEPDGRWIDGSLATIDLKLAPESVEIGRLRLHMMPFVTEDKGQTLRLRCGEGPEQVVEFFPGTLAWRMVDLPLAGVRADTSVRIQIAVAHTFVPSKLGISPDPRALGVMVRRIELVSNAVAEDFVPLAIGSSITLSSADAELMIRLAGFGRPEPDGRWIDGSLATIDLKLAPELVEIGRLRLHMMPFVTEDKGQTLRLRCGEGPEQVVEFSPGTLAWRTVDLPLTGVRADTSVRIQIAVAHTFVPSKLGISPDPRALGVMIQKIDFLSDTVPDRVDEQTRELPTRSSLATEHLVPFAVGASISLGSPDAERMIRLAGFSVLEPDGRWTDGGAATVVLRLAEHTGNGRLRLYFTPFVTSHTGQSIRVKCGDGPELTRAYSPGPRRETALDLPLSGVESNGEISISIKIESPNSPASLGLGSDERRLGIPLRRMEFVAGLSHFTSFARWALRSLIRPMRRVVLKSRDFFTRPLVERIAHLDKQIREHEDARLAVFQTELAHR